MNLSPMQVSFKEHRFVSLVRRKKFQWVAKLCKHLAYTTIAALAGAACTIPFYDKIYNSAYEEGYKYAVENVDWDKKILGNSKEVSATCNRWWFGMNHKVRQIERDK